LLRAANRNANNHPRDGGDQQLFHHAVTIPLPLELASPPGRALLSGESDQLAIYQSRQFLASPAMPDFKANDHRPSTNEPRPDELE
jgi:hypothetical protein